MSGGRQHPATAREHAEWIVSRWQRIEAALRAADGEDWDSDLQGDAEVGLFDGATAYRWPTRALAFIEPFGPVFDVRRMPDGRIVQRSLHSDGRVMGERTVAIVRRVERGQG